MNRRAFLRNSGLGLLAGGLAARQGAAASSPPPNIVLLLSDDLGYGHLGCYGQQLIHTPHLDRMAAEGMRFTQAYAGSSLCAPSRSVLLTGLHAGHTPVRGNTGGIPLREEDHTFAELLQAAGYATALFGKWGLGEHATTGEPNRKGFDEFFGYLHQRHAQFYYTDYLWQNGEKFPLPGNMDGNRGQYTHDIIVERALDYLRQPHERPFLCCVSMTIPHHEWTVPESSLQEYAGKFEEQPPQFKWREGYALPKQPKANMAAMISHLDRSVGQVLDTLREQGLAENTIVLFSSDNGPDSYSLTCADFFRANGDLRGFKGSLYEGGIRVPLIAWSPGRIAAAATSDTPCHFADILPTFADLAGASTPRELDGHSIAPTLLGRGQQARGEYLYWETEDAQAARMGRWKAVMPGPDAPLELYDLEADPAESRNLAAVEQEIATKLAGFLQASHVAPPPQKEPSPPDGRQYY